MRAESTHFLDGRVPWARPPTGRPTSLIRGVRGRARCDHQIDEATPNRHPSALFTTSPPEPAGATPSNPLEPDHEVDPRDRTWLHELVPTREHPLYFERSEGVSDGLSQGLELTEIVAQLLRDQYGPPVVVRSIRDGASVDLEAARRLVDECLADGKFAAMWAAAESVLGFTSDDAVSVLDEGSATRDSEYEGTDRIDWEESLFTIAVERMRELGSDDHAIGWFRERLAALRRPARPFGSVLACVAIDRLDCPAELIDDLLAAAIGLDASTCRAPIATITRTHGLAPVVRDCERLRASGDPGDEQAAIQIEYWLKADHQSS